MGISSQLKSAQLNFHYILLKWRAMVGDGGSINNAIKYRNIYTTEEWQEWDIE